MVSATTQRLSVLHSSVMQDISATAPTAASCVCANFLENCQADGLLSYFSTARYRSISTPFVLRGKKVSLKEATAARKLKNTLRTEEIRDMDAPEASDMVEWFFRLYTDPANGVPYNGREGGYMYTNGGPYDAEDELRENFDDSTSERSRGVTPNRVKRYGSRR